MHRFALVVMLGCTHPTAEPARAAPRPDAIDRFSPSAGHLMVRGGARALPAPGAAIDFDRPPFITQAFGPDGKVVRYYNFDVQPTTPAILYRATHAGARAAIAGQLDIVDALPGDAAYSDFARLAWVEVPDTFVPGSLRSRADVLAAHYAIIDDTKILDCPIVPHGSTAREGNGVAPAVPVQLWYRGTTIDCLRFGDPLDGPTVPTSPIYVTFGHEPDAGFKREGATPQTHNVVLSVPGDADYSPLWEVHVYDARAFELVHDAATALKARIVEAGKLVNCPIVTVEK
jgi:hypothetical protein